MNKLLCILFLLLISFSQNVQALEPNVILTSQDLGYEKSVPIVYTEKIDSQYLGVIVDFNIDGNRYIEAWLYNIKNDQSIPLIFKDSSGNRYQNQSMNLDLNMQKNGMSHFYIKDNKVYNIIYEYGNSIRKGLVLITDLTSLEQKTVEVSDCFSQMSFLETDNYLFIIGYSDCESMFNLYSFSEDEISVAWSLDLSKNNQYYKELGLYPFVFKNKIIVSDPFRLYVFDAISNQSDTLMEGVKDGLDEEDKVLTFVTQYLVDKDDVYVVYSDVKYEASFFGFRFLNKVGNNRIWKTNGTKATTQLEFKFPVEIKKDSNLEHSKLFIMNNMLCWIKEASNNVDSIYLLEPGAIYELGDFKLPGNYDPDNDTRKFKIGKYKVNYPIPDFNNSLNIKWQGKEYIPYVYSILHGKGNTTDIYVNLINVENYNLKVIQATEPISLERNFPLQKYVNLTDFQIAENNSDQIGLFIFGNIVNDIGYQELSFLDYFVYENESLEVPVDSFNIDFKGYSTFQYSYDEEDIAFLFRDSVSDIISLWSINKKIVTPIKNQIFIQKNLFKLYPNPSSQFITLESPGFQNGQFMIVGMDGKVYQNFSFNGHQKNLDISQLSSGMYMTVFVGDGITSTNTFVKSE